MLRRIAVAVVTAVRRSLVRLGVPLLVMGTADIFVQTRGDDATIDAAAVTVILGHAALVATVLVPFLAVLDLMTPDPAQRQCPPGAAHPTALSVLAALGTGFVYLNRTTFTGAGLAAKTDPHVVEGIVVAVGLVALFIVIRVVHVAAWRRAHGRRNVIVMIVLFAGAVGASLADRLVLPGQYRPVHLQLFLGGILAGAAWIGLGPKWLRRLETPIALGVIVLAVLGACSPLIDSAKTWITRLAEAHRLQTSHALGIVAKGRRLVLSDDAPTTIDVASYLARRDVDRDAAAELMRSRCNGKRPNILLVSIDTVRADHIGFLGYDRHPTSPCWDELATQSAVFVNAYTPYPTSNFAYSSMLTSTYPNECPQRFPNDPSFPEGLGFPRRLADAGYATHAVTAFTPKQIQSERPQFGTFPRGFDTFETLMKERQEADAKPIADRAIERLEEFSRDAERPFLLWVHFFDPHTLYVAHAEFPFGRGMIDRYDGEIAYADRQLGRLVDALDRLGLANETVVVVHSDHGEALGDHDSETHHSSVFEEQVRIPLTIRVPGSAGRRLERETISLCDIAPTLLTLTGTVDPFEDRRRGRDLAPSAPRHRS